MEKAKTENLNSNMDQIPFQAIEAIGKIFAEGEIKYGRDNWKKGEGDEAYQRERLNHAILHLQKYANGDTSEHHLAKVAWFCVTQLYFESQCPQVKPTTPPDPNSNFPIIGMGYEVPFMPEVTNCFLYSTPEKEKLISLGAKIVRVTYYGPTTEFLALDYSGKVLARHSLSGHVGTDIIKTLI